MTQSTLTQDCAVSGTTFTALLNQSLETIASLSSGVSAPTLNLYAGRLWLDTSGANPILKIYTGSTWLSFMELAPSEVASTSVRIDGGSF